MRDIVILGLLVFMFAMFIYLIVGVTRECIDERAHKKAKKAEEAYYEDKEWVCSRHGVITTNWTPAYYKTKEGRILFCPLCWLELMDRECERLSLQTIKEHTEVNPNGIN